MSDSRAARAAFFVPGGTLPPDTPSYIERPADNKLYERVLKGDYCYVLTPRQMGKSSLMAHTAVRLKKHGARCAIVDLTQTSAGKTASFEQWLYGIASDIHKGLERPSDFDAWWQAHQKYTPIKRLAEFFGEIANDDHAGRSVIFIDEIESTLAVRSADQFFAAIRACFNARAINPCFAQLNFVLLGVATPDQLIRDARRTPFNIGRRIELSDFDPEEARPLAAGLDPDPERAARLLERVLYWTGGHPYLTQAVCSGLVERGAGDVDALVAELFLSKGAARAEVNLDRTGRQITAHDGYLKARLKLFLRICRGERVPDQPALPAYATLKLSGVVKSVDGELRLRNRIYERVFTDEWAKAALPTDLYRHAAIAAVTAVVAVLAFGWYVARNNTQTLELASGDLALATRAYETLHRIPGYEGKADELFAHYWERRAKGADRDAALLYRLRALATKDTESRRKDAQDLIGLDYEALVMSYRHPGACRIDAAFSANGDKVLTECGNTVQLWRTLSGEPLTKLSFPPIGPNLPIPLIKAQLSPNGNFVVKAFADGTIQLWTADSGHLTATFSEHLLTYLTSIAVSPDSKYVLTGGWPTTRLWSIPSQQSVVELHPQGPVREVAFTFDGRRILIVNADRAPNRKTLPQETYTGELGYSAQVWETTSGRPVGPPLLQTAYAAFSPDGRTVISLDSSSEVRVRRTDSGQPVGRAMRHGPVTSFVSTPIPGGIFVVTGGLNYGVTAVTFSPSGRFVATGGRDQTARVWGAESGQPYGRSLRCDCSPYRPPSLHPEGFNPARESFVEVIAFSPDEKLLLTGCLDGTTQLWRVDSGLQFGPLLHQAIPVGFSPGGGYILTILGGEGARLWRADLDQVPNAPTLTGDPKALLDEWEKKLALRFDDTGKVVPRY